MKEKIIKLLFVYHKVFKVFTGHFQHDVKLFSSSKGMKVKGWEKERCVKDSFSQKTSYWPGTVAHL